MFSSRTKAKVDLDRAQGSSAPVPIPILRPRAEQRKGERKGVWCVCSIYSEDGATWEAIILDVSKSGARIRRRTRGTLPRIVKIKASRIGLHRFARVVWQTTFDAGLEFIAPAKKKPR
ncbi:MAG: PilZ domain-containing protein [Henriciella sp.]|nr:PilZ domain-containing protein [Henriciella sp.]